MNPISIIILTYNEEIHIERCLKNVINWADEVFVVDSFSTDRTAEIAKEYSANVVEHVFQNQAQQFNWALDNLDITSEWVLRLDADEYLTMHLKEEISMRLKQVSSGVNGFFIRPRVYFMGKWIRHGGYHSTWLLRLFRKSQGRCEDRVMAEHIILKEGRAVKLSNDFIHDNKKSLGAWISKHNEYASREVEVVRNAFKNIDEGLSGQAAKKRWIKKNIYYRLPLFFRATLYFFYRYSIRLGFLDGKEGLIFHFLQAFWYRFLVDAKIYEKQQKHNVKATL